MGREWHGPTYTMAPSDQHHAGDPMRQIALRQPDPYQHPEHLGRDVLDPGGPRILPVSQRIQPGDEPSQEQEFEQGQSALGGPPWFLEDFDDEFEHDVRGIAHGYSNYVGYFGFNDRRIEGRRHRPIDNVTEILGQQRPYPPAPAPADLPPEAFVRGW